MKLIDYFNCCCVKTTLDFIEIKRQQYHICTYDTSPGGKSSFFPSENVPTISDFRSLVSVKYIYIREFRFQVHPVENWKL